MAKKSQHSILRTFAFILNLIFAVCLLISYLAIYISPDQYWYIAFFGLAYPFLLLINLFFVLGWLILFKKQLLLSLIVILIGFNYLNSSFQISAKHLKDNDKSIKVLSYNVRLFNVYKYKKLNKERYNERNKIFGFIKAAAADILCFQEFYYDRSGKFITLDSIVKFQDAIFYHTAYTSEIETNMYFSGIATFSKYPIINKGKLKFDQKSDNLCIFSDIVKGEDTIRVYNIHLESIRLSKEDEMFYDDIGNQNEQDGIKMGSRKILSKLKHAFIKRASQARTIADHIKQSPYPVLVCGDFNDPPVSYAYHIVSQNLKDAFIESGRGIGNSYNGKFPSFRIDYILHSSEFSAYDFEVKKADYSDHFPVVARIVKKSKD
ncbi:MAG: endonuclease/exonuclease/phosphatase family protein [Bacteroidota bacterium]